MGSQGSVAYLSMTQVPEQEAGSLPRLLTVGQVAEILNVDVTTISDWARNGKIAFVTLPSGQRRYRREDIEAILAGTPSTEAGAA